METRYQEQMESPKEAMQASNERAMVMVESIKKKIMEVMLAVTQRTGAPTFKQPVMLPVIQTVKPLTM